MKDMKVKDVMTHLVVTLRPQDSIQEAARRLLNNRISGAPVVERGLLVGIFSEADLVAAYAPPARSGTPFVAVDPIRFLLRGVLPREAGHTTVADIMTRDVVSVSPDASLWEAASLIDRHGFRRLPVVDPDGYVVGVLARADLVRAMVRSDEDLVPAVKSAIEVLGEENFTSLGVEASGGAVTISGTADRRTTHDFAIRIASQVPGVLEVVDELDWQWDDRNVKPARNPSDPRDVRKTPWVVGPFVREGT